MLIAIYMLLTWMMGVSVLWNVGMYPGIASLVGPTLCWFAASGLKGSLLVGTVPEKLAGLGAAIVFVTVGTGIVYHAGYWVRLFGYEFTGVTWCLASLVVGWISTKRQHAV